MKQLIQYMILIALVGLALVIFFYDPDNANFVGWLMLHIALKAVAFGVMLFAYWLSDTWEGDLTLLGRITGKMKDIIDQ